MAEEVRYAELTPEKLHKRITEQPIAYIPLGSLEYHGEHLPYGTDIMQSEWFLCECAKKFGGVVLPPFFVGPGLDDECSCYRIDPDLFDSLLTTIVRRLVDLGFKAVFADGHGPSRIAWHQIARRMSKETGYCFPRTDRNIRKHIKFMHDHAGKKETSTIMLIRSDLVDLSTLPDDTSKWPPCVTGQDPRTATVEYGKACVQLAMNWLEQQFKNGGML